MSLGLNLAFKPIPSYNDKRFIISNELKRKETLTQFAQAPRVGESVFGVSCLEILDKASVRPEIQSIYIFDKACTVAKFWGKMLPILAQNSDRLKALENLKILLKEEKEDVYLLFLKGEIDSKRSFLSDDARYDRIHQLAKNGKIYFEPADLTNQENTKKIINYFQKNNITFDLIYLSNIEECSSIQGSNVFARFVQELQNSQPDSSPHVISAHLDEQDFHIQRFKRGNRIEAQEAKS